MEKETNNIYAKLLAAQKQLPCLVKEKAKNDGLKYTFVSHDEVTTEVKKVFFELGLLCLSTVDSSEFSEVEVEKWDYNAKALKKAVNTFCTLNITVKIVNAENPTEIIETKAVGQGIDEGDKATGKAYSYAFKYALLKLMMAETAEDSDKDQQTSKLGKTLSVNDTGLKKKEGIEINARINKLLDAAQSLEDLKAIWVENTQDLNKLKLAGVEWYEPLEKRKNELKAAFDVYTKEGDL